MARFKVTLTLTENILQRGAREMARYKLLRALHHLTDRERRSLRIVKVGK